MIQKSVNLYFVTYILEIGIEQNLAVLGAEWEQNGKQNCGTTRTRREPKTTAATSVVFFGYHESWNLRFRL